MLDVASTERQQIFKAIFFKLGLDVINIIYILTRAYTGPPGIKSGRKYPGQAGPECKIFDRQQPWGQASRGRGGSRVIEPSMSFLQFYKNFVLLLKEPK